MAPPRTTPRLQDLAPRDVARAAVDRAYRRIIRLGMRLGPALVIAGDTPDEYCDLGQTVAHLTGYARTGALGDWEDGDDVVAAIHDVLQVLWPAAGPGPLAEVEGELDDDDPVALVVLAAWARASVDTGVPVTLRELGALAGLHRRPLQALAASGELRVTDERPARVKAAEARRWLSGRGVTGFEQSGARGAGNG